MKEFKILIILIVVVGVIYYGVEPYAHSVMHPKVAPADFAFKDLEPMDLK
ncbi:cytochrome c1, partial [Helicobacter pylori]|nr:cytochrome c1 [Helicobacter pylori]